MIKEIVKDQEKLKAPCKKATKNDLGLIKDLIDTAEFHKERCLGLAANQLGYDKCIIIVADMEGKWISMVNPIIIHKSTEQYSHEESCLSLDGYRKVTRFKSVDVIYFDKKMKIQKMRYFGRLAAEIQHEIDHLNGILI
ncbi:peptide deformylase [Anaerocolumna cellulosilytica]|uniref:Peptide deformylase n=1 Tax=Anaerocolumna cellulosilytica TaxID=433286 RepID=A0A6S6R0J7_9FIRM|nr:peptide deformylase [Anaerocolumna cellulosilytica]MBB5198095.1 peptide deformylase [Anaerocolumna cellulosilytica]BCJ93072.1 peptide deformylase [Anaerocolumna cellulosilytica]